MGDLVRIWSIRLSDVNRLYGRQLELRADMEAMESRALQRLMTVNEIAEYLQVKPSTIYQWTHQGYIPHVKLGNRVRFRLSQIDVWIEKKAKNGRALRSVNVL
jgi:excisionase family DNA binding protein